jgi:hypothetical protein
MIILLIILLIIIFLCQYKQIEPFIDQTIVPKPAPDQLSWDFRSPKSAIKNFNETTQLHQNYNHVQAVNSSLVDKYQPLPDWVYPYTYVNRRFDQILLTIAHKMEKDVNKNERLHDRNNQEWRFNYPYVITSWESIESRVKNLIIDVINEINKRFNMEVPIVGFRRDEVKYYWINQETLIISLNVHKKYTIEDIKYFDAIDPNINQHLKMNFERELIIYLDDIDQSGGYHLKYLRFPKIDYENDDVWDDLYYAKEFDNLFYLARSKDKLYRMLSNTEARDIYIEKIEKEADTKKYKCFTPQLDMHSMANQLKNQTDCEVANGQWIKQCEKDTDCPYYQSNKNYPNNYGGCNKKTGYCEMPLGVSPLTFREPSNPQAAYCYNCQNGFLGPQSIGQCCPEQQPSPDYMFLNDVDQRRENAEILKQKNLIWSKFP